MVYLSPEYIEVMYKANQLKSHLADKIVEKDFLINYICMDYKVEYLLKIGTIEYKKMLAQNDIEKLKRKIQIVKELEVFNEKEIDDMINEEFKGAQEIQKDLFEDINIAIDYSIDENRLTQEQVDDMNRDYSVIVHSWNPTINEKLSKEKQDLFETAEEAYREGNYKLLHNYVQLINEDELIEQGELVDLKNLVVKYQMLCKATDSVIQAIKNSFPYCEKPVLDDENLLQERKESLNKELNDANQELKKLKKEFKELKDDKNFI